MTSSPATSRRNSKSLEASPPRPRAEELERALVNLQSLITPLEYIIFRELAFEHAEGQTVADRHGLSRNAVYLHKRHALQKLEEILRPKP
ncbi:MAG: hypothetical protein U1G05_10530 [Kiritimatiellia bacterium]